MVSVIVVNCNGKKYLRNCLDSLYEADGEKEIIVIDNGSTDGSRRFLYDEQVFGKIRFFDYYLNEGLAKASNKGASFAKGEYLFFLNNDTMVEPNIFTELLKIKTSIVGCRMFDYRGIRELDSKLVVDRFGYPAGKGKRIFYPDGAIFIKKSVFDELGGFDEKLFLYGEDRDLCWRALLMGFPCGYSDSAVFYHNTTSVNDNKRNKSFDTNYFRRKLSEKNTIRSMLKNYSFVSLFKILPQYLFWSILELTLLMFIDPKAIWKSYLPAYWWNILNLKDTVKERRKIQKTRLISDKTIREIMSKKIGKLFVLQTFGLPKFLLEAAKEKRGMR